MGRREKRRREKRWEGRSREKGRGGIPKEEEDMRGDKIALKRF